MTLTPDGQRVYVFDSQVHRMSVAATSSMTEVAMVVASYLIVHPKGTLLWDTGAIPDSNLKPDASPVTQGLFTATKALKSQLAAAGYTAKDITYLGLSHYHGDHIANANDFAGST